MIITFTPQYLEKLIVLELPEIGDRTPEDYERVIFDYAELRNLAKDLLRNNGNQEARNELETLITKLEIKI